MDRTRHPWSRIQHVLDQALELEPHEVADFLDRACEGDPALRAEVESLIEADRSAPAFLDGRAFVLPIDVQPASAPAGRLEGSCLGKFRVLHEIGRGGMSVVHGGERADGEFEQRVAIKVLQRDGSVTGLAERFRTERRILGALDHRNIVRILDGGLTPDGRPYFVMEYIEGERIDRWCDARRLTIEQRLRLFRQVLGAVSWAHRALVVHRDLKPANILVTTTGEVRLLDFGIAKLLDAHEEADAAPTQSGLRPMTPRYAAPEQVRGDPATTSCDVYALGVLLYELLTGYPPYGDDPTTAAAIERAILEVEPDRPSRAVRRTGTKPTGDGTTAEAVASARGTDPVRLRGTLDGDLDAIVLKALRKEPEERYASVDALRDDIDRYLDSLPVEARRGSRSYRARKFVRRHRLGVGVAAAAAILVLGSTAAIAASRLNAERARERAEREARTAREVTDFLVDVFAGRNPGETLGDTVSARTLLERGHERIERELAGEPLVRASLLDAIGRAYGGLGRYDLADSLLAEAVGARATIAADDPGLIESLVALGETRILAHEYPGSLEPLERALALHRPFTTDSSALHARILTNLGVSLRETGDPDSSRVLLRRAVALDSVRGDSTSRGYFSRRMALAATYRALEDYDAAADAYEDLLPRLRSTFGDDHPHYSTALNNAAFLRTRQGRPADAVPLYREALAIARRAYGPDHPRVQTLLGNTAGALALVGAYGEAVAALRERIESAHRTWPDGHWRLGSAYQGLGKLMLQAGRVAEADTAFRVAQASFRETIGPQNTWTIIVDAWIGLTATLQNSAEGPAMLDRAIADLQGARPDPDTVADAGRIATSLDRLGMTDRADRLRDWAATR